MSFIDRLLGKRSSLENPQTPLSNPSGWLINLFGGGPSGSSISVTPETALQCAPFLAAVNVLSNAIASLPLHLYRRPEAGDVEKATDHPLYRVLHEQANDELTSFRWRRLMMKHICTHGEHFSRIEFGRRNEVKAFWPLEPCAMRVERLPTGRLRYSYQLRNGGVETLDADEVLHLTYMDSDDGLKGISPVQKGKEAIGLAIALEQFGARFFANDARPGMVLEFPNQLSQQAIANLKDSIKAQHEGIANKHKTMILEDGGKVHTIQVEPEHAQFTEARAHQLLEIARLLNVPPVFLQDLSKATFTNNEQQDLHFVKHTLRPWLVMIEQELTIKLLSAQERKTMVIEFNVDGLLRGDFATRMNGYAQGVQNGVLKPNEARAKENLPADPMGDKLMIQGATVPIGVQPVTAQSELDNDTTEM